MWEFIGGLITGKLFFGGSSKPVKLTKKQKVLWNRYWKVYNSTTGPTYFPELGLDGSTSPTGSVS